MENIPRSAQLLQDLVWFNPIFNLLGKMNFPNLFKTQCHSSACGPSVIVSRSTNMCEEKKSAMMTSHSNHLASYQWEWDITEYISLIITSQRISALLFFFSCPHMQHSTTEALLYLNFSFSTWTFFLFFLPFIQSSSNLKKCIFKKKK